MSFREVRIPSPVVSYFRNLLTKSNDTRKIVTSSYTYSDSDRTYILKDFGKLEVIDDKQIAFTPDGGTRKVYDATSTLIVTDGTAATLLNRTWVISKTILEFRSANYQFDGLNLNEIEKIARDQGIEFKYHMADGMVAKKFVVTDALAAALFQNGEAYAAEHNLRSGTEFKLSEFTNGLKGDANVQFRDGETDKCYITINTTLDESPAKVILNLVAE